MLARLRPESLSQPLLLLVLVQTSRVAGQTCSGVVPADLAGGGNVIRHFKLRDSDPRLGTYDRQYAVTLPKVYDGKTPVPLLMYFHGWGEDFHCVDSKCSLSDYGAHHGYVVVKPKGMADGGPSSWNLGTANHTDTCSPANVSKYDYTSCSKTGVTSICNCGTCYDDFRFLSELIAALMSELCLDSDQIYASGASFGALFNYYAASELSEHAGVRFRAILPWYGAFYRHTQRVPKHPVSVFHFHGLLDEEVPPGGGMSGDGYLYIPVEQTLNDYAAAFGCHARPTALSTPFDGRGELLGCKEWRDCKHGVKVVRCNWHKPHGFWPNYAEQMMWWFLEQLNFDKIRNITVPALVV